jgi:hypothetical protein
MKSGEALRFADLFRQYGTLTKGEPLRILCGRTDDMLLDDYLSAAL